jgi:crotonobetainyl-CoA:carnitine CoA-transferase CaiB-like acyl-CoA transferase
VPQTKAPLSGWVVVDLSTGIAGAYCTKLLADGGARVIKVEPPEGDPLRGWSASGATIREGDDGALFQFLGTSKLSVVADPAEESDLAGLRDLLRDADAVVWSPESRLAKIESFTPRALLQDHPHLIVTSITPFGLDGPWSDRPATEFTLQAWSGGMIGLGRGDPDRAPAFVGGQVGSWLAGAFAAAGTMLSRLMSGGPGAGRAGGEGAGEVIDVSMLEALAMCLTYYPVTYVDAMERPFRSGRSVVTPGIGSAQDGMIAVGVGTGQHWLDFCVMVGHPEWMEDKSLFRQRGRLAPEIDRWFANHTVDEIRDLATAFRLPNAPIANGASLPGIDQFVARHSFVSNPGGGFLQPDRPYRMHPARLCPPEPSPTLGADTGPAPGGDRPTRPDPSTGLALSGLRVLDMTAFWAGPSCTHVLAMLGAEVIHLESTGRLDGTRMLGPSFKVDEWWERSPIFSGMNTNKKSLTLDFHSERGMQLLRSLIATTDVIVENYTPRVLDQVGLTFDELRSLRDDIVLIRMPGFGLDGPWRDNAAFAYTIEDASGLTWLTGHPDQLPLEPYCIGDPNAGIHALVGLLLALEHRRRTGEAVAVEAAMIDAALNVTAEQVVEYSAYGSLLERAGNRGPTAAPQNLYRAADADEHGQRDCWVAIAVETDGQWAAMVHTLGRPHWATGAPLSTGRGRADHHDLIDEHLALWCGERRADEIVGLLWPAGVPVARVMQPHQQGDLPQLQARGFFEVVDHPVSGKARHSTLPMRFSTRAEPVHRRHAPLLGEHNVELLGALGLSEADIAELEIEGVIGRIPVGAHPPGARD